MKFTYLRYIGDNNLPFQHRDYIDNPSPKYDQYTSEIKSDLSIPEQIIEVFYNTTFIEKCKLWLFEQYKEHYIFNYFTDYEDFLTYDALRYADEYEEGYDEKVKHYVRYKRQKGEEVIDVSGDTYNIQLYQEATFYRHSCETFHNTLNRVKLDYNAIFGWDNPNCTFIDLYLEMEYSPSNEVYIFGEDYDYLFTEKYDYPSPKLQDAFNNFVECYPQYSSQFRLFNNMTYYIYMFNRRKFSNPFTAPYYEVRCRFDLREHIELLEDMAEFFSRKSSAKSARSTIDIDSTPTKYSKENEDSQIH